MKKGLQLGRNLQFPMHTLVKHFVAFGATGSGKTVLTKALIEECALKHIPAIVVDSQGDLASLSVVGTSNKISEQGLDAKQERFFDSVEVVTYTPTSSKGVPLSVNPLAPVSKEVDEETAIGLLSQRAEGLAVLLGYKTDSLEGKAALSSLYLVLEYAYKKHNLIQSIDGLIEFLSHPPNDFDLSSVASTKQIHKLIKNLKYLTIGEKKLLFSFGTPLDVETLLGKHGKKTRISVIFMNSLDSQKEKDFFLSMLAQALYQWMLDHPKSSLQALFVIDEIAPYLPSGMRETLSKSILRLLYKQARKYGIGCVMSTQNPGDVDYKAFAQFGTVAVGRLTTKQDRKKVEDTIKALSPHENLDSLATLQTGNFLLFCPDAYSQIQRFQVRYLLTEHTTLTEANLSKLTPKKKKRPVSSVVGKGIEPTLSEKDIRERAQALRKKQFVLLGKPVEEVKTVRLHYRPYHLVTLKYLSPRLMSKKPKVNHVNFFVDGVNASLGKCTELGFSAASTALYPLVGLESTTVRMYKHLHDSRHAPSTAELLQAFGKTTKKHLEVLNNAKLITSQRKQADLMWVPLEKLRTPRLSALEHTLPSIQHVEITAKQEPLYNPVLINSIMKGLYDGVEVMNTDLIWLPEYEVEFNSRTIRLSALSGKQLR